MAAFEWDDAKNAANVAKHGLSFQLAVEIFQGPVMTAIVTRAGVNETREISVGRIPSSAVVAVVHTVRGPQTRIISARPASRQERGRYEEALRAADEQDRPGDDQG